MYSYIQILCILFVFMSFPTFIVKTQETQTGNAEELFKQGEEHYFKGRYTLALNLLERVISLDARHVKAYRYAGDIYLDNQNIKKAKEYFLTSKELAKNPAEDLFRLGQVYLIEGNGQQAINSLQASLRNNPKLHLAHYYLGQTYYQLYGNDEKTIEYWESYRDKTPDKDHTKLNKAIEYLKNKLKEKERAEKEKAAQIAAAAAAKVRQEEEQKRKSSVVSTKEKKTYKTPKKGQKKRAKKIKRKVDPIKDLELASKKENQQNNKSMSDWNSFKGWNKLGPFVFNHWSLFLIFALIGIIVYLIYKRSRYI